MTDTTTKTKPDLAAIYTPGQLGVINELRRLQDEAGLNDGKFATAHLTVSGTTWYRIKEGTYGADPALTLNKLELNLRQMRLQRAQAAKLTGGGVFIRIPSQQAVFDAVTACKLKPEDDCERMVTFLAETGGGKTRLARQLKVEHDGILVEASEPWRKSYFAALFDIGLAAGLTETELGNGEATAQRAVVRRLRANRRVLIIDEGEYFGPRTTNLLKLLLNQTPTVVVVMAIPALFARWQCAAWVESAQTTRRNESVIESSPVFPDDVAALAAGRVIFADTAKAACGLIAKNANEFGRFSFVERTLKELAPLPHATIEDVTKACLNVKALLRRKA
ncbi:hypothetical protein OPIT5_08235 [Opitutaceae bacterium TAV5]|nr:hypothetical protein OPIT5_08235 [Opitutaceae bacterium TAV5]